jgi:hypothetical protein
MKDDCTEKGKQRGEKQGKGRGERDYREKEEARKRRVYESDL